MAVVPGEQQRGAPRPRFRHRAASFRRCGRTHDILFSHGDGSLSTRHARACRGHPRLSFAASMTVKVVRQRCAKCYKSPWQSPAPSRQTAFRPAQRRVFRRLCQAGLCRARAGDALGGDRRRRHRRPCRAAEDPVAAAGGGAAAGTGDAGAAGRGADGAGNPAHLRRDPGAGQPLLRLERGRPAGAAPGAAVAPEPARARPRAGPEGGAPRSPKPCPRSRTRHLRAALARLGAAIKRN